MNGWKDCGGCGAGAQDYIPLDVKEICIRNAFASLWRHFPLAVGWLFWAQHFLLARI